MPKPWEMNLKTDTKSVRPASKRNTSTGSKPWEMELSEAPGAPLREPAAQETEAPETSTLEAIGRGVGTGVSGGWLDEIVSGIMSGGKHMLQSQQEMLGMRPKEEHQSLREMYQEAQKGTEEREKAARLQHPTAYTAADIVGTATQAPKGLLKNVLMGAVHGAGRSEESVLDPEALLGDVAMGAGTAALGYGAGKGIEKVAGAVKPWAARQAMKVTEMGKKTAKNLRKLRIKPEEVDELLYNKRILTDAPETTLQNVENAMYGKGQTGEQIGNLVSEASVDAPLVSKMEVGRSLRKVLKEAKEIDPNLGNQLKRQAKKLAKDPRKNLTLKEVHAERMKIDKLMKSAGKYKSSEAGKSAADVFLEGRTEVNNLLKNKLKEVMSPEQFKKYSKLNKEYTIYTQVRPSLEDAIDKGAAAARRPTQLSKVNVLDKIKDLLTSPLPSAQGTARLADTLKLLDIGKGVGKGLQRSQIMQPLLDE